MSVFDLSSRLVDEIAALSPVAATAMGIPGYDHLWPDYSPAGVEAAGDALGRYRVEAEELPTHEDEWEQLAGRVLTDFLDQSIERIDQGEHFRDLNNTASPLQSIVQIFDLMDTGTNDGRHAVLERLATLDVALDSYRAALEEGITRGTPVARRQVQAAVEECRAYAADGSFVDGLLERLDRAGVDRADVVAAAAKARRAFNDLASWLEEDYSPVAAERDAVGEERYVRSAARFLGASIDPAETYAWGWSEVRQIWDRMHRVAAEISSNTPVAEVLHVLKTDPERCVADEEAFLRLMKSRQQDAVERLAGTHFDIPDAIRSVDVKLAPPGSALGAYYHQPSEDFERPGAVFYALGDRRPIPVYDEVSTTYHEGFPGHHLQVGLQVGLAGRLSRLHRMVVWYPGYGEGWALYAEQLMDELGFYEKADYVMGLLINQMHRACRVVIDIGSHLEYPIPDDSGFHPGEPWSFDLAVEMLESRAFLEPAYARSEVLRYLGWPGQAISYKVGERVILDLRRELQRLGDFDMKAFHSRILGYGPLGLDHLREVMAF